MYIIKTVINRIHMEVSWKRTKYKNKLKVCKLIKILLKSVEN